ncbi:prenyltransferase [Oceanobacillus sp. FSL H7-0719]|uniref:prenyltransferase n=1 Tax=Oceanobacillus sp. FSL H7-0719 TaxID=2954507 RepID=UPI0032538FF8
MKKSFIRKLQGGWMLLRFIAVISSSIVTILSSLLPLFLYTSISTEYLFFAFIFLSIAAITFHGVLVHLFNDYADFLTGTDAHSPAILSGGSRVIQKGFMEPQHVLKTARWLAIALLAFAILMAVIGRYELTILIIIGIWSAISYSLPPFRLSYRPFLGEALSLFPAIFFLGIAGPWIILDSVPLWAYQNAVINALVCMGWVMVHHIPDIEADMQALPKKQTTVVWFVERFGIGFARFPAFIYLLIAAICAVWTGMERTTAGLVTLGIMLAGMILIMRMNPENVKQVTVYEKLLLLFAVLIAIVLGVFR